MLEDFQLRHQLLKSGRELMTIRKKDIRKIVSDYQQYFPGWVMLGDKILVRENGPVAQGILFNLATSDVYRPTGFVRVLCSPNVIDAIPLELAQPLRHRNGAPDRSIGLLSHNNVIAEVVKDLKKQIVPTLDQPLDPQKTLALHTKMAFPTMNEAYSLAFLNAYFGIKTDARKWISTFRKLLDDWLRSNMLTDLYIRESEQWLHELEIWLNIGSTHFELEKIVQQERQKMGLV